MRRATRLADPLVALIHDIILLILQHQALALGGIIGLEELGVPLPVPGDVFLLYSGYLVNRGKLGFWSAVGATVLFAVIGSSGLYWLARRLGSEAVERYGALIRLTPERLERVEAYFRRYGLPAILVGRFIPGMRIVLSALAGLLLVPYPTFALAVAGSSFIWAVVLLEIGEHLGKRVRGLLEVSPLHLVPGLILLLFVLGLVFIGRRRTRLQHEREMPSDQAQA